MKLLYRFSSKTVVIEKVYFLQETVSLNKLSTKNSVIEKFLLEKCVIEQDTYVIENVFYKIGVIVQTCYRKLYYRKKISLDNSAIGSVFCRKRTNKKHLSRELLYWTSFFNAKLCYRTGLKRISAQNCVIKYIFYGKHCYRSSFFRIILLSMKFSTYNCVIDPFFHRKLCYRTSFQWNVISFNMFSMENAVIKQTFFW